MGEVETNSVNYRSGGDGSVRSVEQDRRDLDLTERTIGLGGLGPYRANDRTVRAGSVPSK